MTKLAACLVTAVVALGALGCREEGALEKAGRKVDEAIDKLQHGDESALERAGRKIDEAVEDAEEKLKSKK